MQSIVSQLDKAFRTAIRAAVGFDADPLVTVSQNEKFGDYQSNAAMGLSGQLAQRTGQKTNPAPSPNKLKRSSILVKWPVRSPSPALASSTSDSVPSGSPTSSPPPPPPMRPRHRAHPQTHHHRRRLFRPERRQADARWPSPQHHHRRRHLPRSRLRRARCHPSKPHRRLGHSVRQSGAGHVVRRHVRTRRPKRCAEERSRIHGRRDTGQRSRPLNPKSSRASPRPIAASSPRIRVAICSKHTCGN